MFHVIRQTLRSAYLSMMGTFAKPAVGIHIISGHRIEDELEPETFKKLLSNLSKYVKFIRIEEAITMIVNKVEQRNLWLPLPMMMGLWSVMMSSRLY